MIKFHSLLCILLLVASKLSFAEGMQYPLAVVADQKGIVYVADRNLPGIWKIESGKASVYFQGSKKFRTPLNAVRCVAVDSKGTLYAGDSSTREVYRFNESGTPEPLTQGKIGIPMAIAIDQKGDLLVADLELHCIYHVPAVGGQATEYVKTPAPRGVAVDSQNRVIVLANTKQPVIRFDEARKPETVVSDAMFEFAHQIVVDAKGTFYLSDGYSKTIWKMISGGKPEKLFQGEPLKNPVGIALDGDRLLIADPHQKMIYSLPTSGQSTPEAIVKL
jgi:streptogramin lyase